MLDVYSILDYFSFLNFSTGDVRKAHSSSCLFLFLILVVQCNFRSSVAVMTVHEQDLEGEVESGNYTYYNLKSDFNDGKPAAVVLLLFSTLGDADLYVSRTITKPTFEHGQHDFQSTSCGIDRVDINLNVPPPAGKFDSRRTAARSATALTVGVYGHTSNPLSRYLLKVMLFVDDNPVLSDQSYSLKLSDEKYMSDEMLVLALADRWREWVQQIHVSDDDLSGLSGTSSLSDATIGRQSKGEGFREFLKSVGEVMLAILSFVLNILVEVLV